jgi:hypothetical protein
MSSIADNVQKVTQAIANIALPMFVNRLSFLPTGNYDIEEVWKDRTYEYGDTVNVRRQNMGRVGDGQAATPTPVIDRVEPLTINHQYNQMFNYSAKDATLVYPQDRKKFADRYLKSRINQIVSQMEQDIGTLAGTTAYLRTGTPGTPINNYQTLDAPSQVMRVLGIPTDDLYQAISTTNGPLLRAAYSNNFNAMINNEVNKRGVLGHLGLFDIFENPVIDNTTFTSNLAANETAQIQTSVANGATTITLNTFASAANGTVIKAGDMFTISGVYFVNKETFATTNKLVTCTVQAPATIAAGSVTLSISPDLTWASTVTNADTSVSANPIQNISAQPTATTVVTFVGGTSVTKNIAYMKDALTIACPAIAPLDTPYSAVARHPSLPVAIRISRIGDIYASQNICRMDVLAGFLWHGEYMVMNLS